jgi:hypothetical protein
MIKNEKYFSVVLNEETFLSKTERGYITRTDVVSDIVHALDSKLLRGGNSQIDTVNLIARYFGTKEPPIFDQKNNSLTLFFTEEEARSHLGYGISDEEIVTEAILTKEITEYLLRHEPTKKKAPVEVLETKWMKIINALCIIAGVLVFAVTISAGFHFYQSPQCKDGWPSFSIGLPGACSHHGGVDRSNPGIIFFLFSPLTGGFTWLLLSAVVEERRKKIQKEYSY